VWRGAELLWPFHVLVPCAPAVLPAQVKYILGLKIDRADRIQDYLKLIFENLYQFK
jgi:hypothetical protein